MAKGYNQHQARLESISWLGKDLARRAGRKCEWCEGNDDLRPYDSDPNGEPSLETLALFCQRCRQVADGRQDDPQTLRFLGGAIWHEVDAVKDTAIAALKRTDASWARDALDLIGE